MLSLGWIVFLHASSSIGQDAPEGPERSSMFNNAELETLLHIATTFPAPLGKKLSSSLSPSVAQFVAPSVIIEFRNFTKGLKLVTVSIWGEFSGQGGVSSGHSLQQKCG